MQWLAFGDGCLRCWSQRKSSVDDDDRIRIRIRIRSDRRRRLSFPFSLSLVLLLLSPPALDLHLPPLWLAARSAPAALSKCNAVCVTMLLRFGLAVRHRIRGRVPAFGSVIHSWAIGGSVSWRDGR